MGSEKLNNFFCILAHFGIVFLHFTVSVESHGYQFLCSAQSEQSPIAAGQEVNITFTMRPYDDLKDQQKWSDLIPWFTRKFHVMIVDSNHQFFAFVHPEAFSDSISNNSTEWSIKFTPPHAGTYFLAFDTLERWDGHIESKRSASSGPTIVISNCINLPSIEVVGTPAVSPALNDSAAIKVFKGTDWDGVHYNSSFIPSLLEMPDGSSGYRVEFSIVGRVSGASKSIPLVLKETCVQFQLKFTDVTDLRPFLGAAMHFAITKQDLSLISVTNIFHSWGIASGQMNTCLDTGVNARPFNSTPPVPDVFGPTIQSSFKFPNSGQYFIYGIANKNNQQLIFTSFQINVVDVLETEAPIPPIATSVQVSEPQSISKSFAILVVMFFVFCCFVAMITYQKLIKSSPAPSGPKFIPLQKIN